MLIHGCLQAASLGTGISNGPAAQTNTHTAAALPSAATATTLPAYIQAQPQTHITPSDEALSSDSLSTTGGRRAIMAGSSFADSDGAAAQPVYPSESFMDAESPMYSSHIGSQRAPSPSAAGKALAPVGVQLSSRPILGGEGTFTVQPLAHPGQLHQQQLAPSVAPSGSRQGESELTVPNDSTEIEVTRSSAGTEALERGRAGLAAEAGLHEERSLRSTYSAGTVQCLCQKTIFKSM